MADYCPLGYNTWEVRFNTRDCRHAKGLTILHATYPSIASPVTSYGQIPGQSSTRVHCLPQIHGSRGKRIQGDSWRWVHPQYREGYAVDRIFIITFCRQKYAHPTSIVGSRINWIDREIERATENEHIPVRAYPTGQTCRHLDSLLYRRLSAKSQFSRH